MYAYTCVFMYACMQLCSYAYIDCGSAPSVNLNCEDYYGPYTSWSAGNCDYTHCEANLACSSGNKSYTEKVK